MARIIKQPNGGRIVQFEGLDGKKRSLRLGKAPDAVADQVKIRVDRMLACLKLAIPFDPELELWIRSLSEEMASRFVAVGLIAERKDNHLGRFLDAFVASRNDTKKSTRDNMQVMVERVKEYFKPDRQIHTITHPEALDFAAWLRKQYAATTAHRTLGRARQAFGEALRRDLIIKNPFAGVRLSAAPQTGRKCFITREMVKQVMEACPDSRWRLIFALCRFAGFRCPSEHLALRWGDIDWDRGRIHILSPKTGERWCPLFPELRPYLQEAHDAAPDYTVNVFDKTITNRTNLRTQFSRIITRAGLPIWPKIFHNLRASCETELVEVYPIHVVCSWLGNSSAIAQKHYLQVRDENFNHASGAKCGATLGQNAVQSGQAATSTDKQLSDGETNKALTDQGLEQEYSITCGSVQVPFSSPGSTGTTDDSKGNMPVSGQSGA